MIGLDATILIRYIMRDDPEETRYADAVFATLTPREPAYLCVVVLVELWRILGRVYGRTAEQRRQLFEALLETDELQVENEHLVRQSLIDTGRGADFPDALLSYLTGQSGCRLTLTLDRQAAELTGMTAAQDWSAPVDSATSEA